MVNILQILLKVMIKCSDHAGMLMSTFMWFGLHIQIEGLNYFFFQKKRRTIVKNAVEMIRLIT